jgi:hypothetical protein
LLKRGGDGGESGTFGILPLRVRMTTETDGQQKQTDGGNRRRQEQKDAVVSMGRSRGGRHLNGNESGWIDKWFATVGSGSVAGTDGEYAGAGFAALD